MTLIIATLLHLPSSRGFSHSSAPISRFLCVICIAFGIPSASHRLSLSPVTTSRLPSLSLPPSLLPLSLVPPFLSPRVCLPPVRCSRCSSACCGCGPASAVSGGGRYRCAAAGATPAEAHWPAQSGWPQLGEKAAAAGATVRGRSRRGETRHSQDQGGTHTAPDNVRR